MAITDQLGEPLALLDRNSHVQLHFIGDSSEVNHGVIVRVGLHCISRVSQNSGALLLKLCNSKKTIQHDVLAE
jgi:hypothetical protein